MENNLVTTILQGGLGNIMFQIAATIGYAKKHNKTYRFYSQFHHESNHGSIQQYKTNILKNLELIDLQKEPNKFYRYEEPCFHYKEIPYFSNNIALLGYFQSSKYFDEFSDHIRDFFNFDLEQNNYKELLDNNIVCSIHVRRGDYLKLSPFHVTQDITYYQNAVQLFEKDTKFFIISDDIVWCKNNFNTENFSSKVEFIFSENKSPTEDFYCSMKCNHNIIGNSTFSWWSAWMNKYTDKRVVCPHPDRWFGPSYKDKDPKDVACYGWECI